MTKLIFLSSMPPRLQCQRLGHTETDNLCYQSFPCYNILMSQCPPLSNGEFLGNSIPCAENCLITVSAQREFPKRFTGVIPVIATLILNICPRSICCPPISLVCLAVRTNCAIIILFLFLMLWKPFLVLLLTNQVQDMLQRVSY